MKRLAVSSERIVALASLIWAWMAVGVGTANGQIVGYSPSQPSPVNPTGPAVYDPRFDRFSTNFGKQGSPGTEEPRANPSSTFVAAGVDLSGVGWLMNNPVFSFAMITPRHFITAAHNGETAFPGASVTFFTGNASTSTTVNATVASVARVTSTPGSTFPVTDLLLGTLTANVPSSVTSYAIPVGARPQYTGLPVNIYTQFHQVGTNNVTQFFDNQNIDNPSLINNSTNLIAYDRSPGPDGETFFQVGDSGKPTFLNLGGQFTLLGSHSAIATDTNGVQYSLDAFVPDYVTQISAMLPPGFNVRVVPVPEPTFTLTAVAVGVGAWTGWRRVRRVGRARAA